MVTDDFPNFDDVDDGVRGAHIARNSRVHTPEDSTYALMIAQSGWDSVGRELQEESQ